MKKRDQVKEKREDRRGRQGRKWGNETGPEGASVMGRGWSVQHSG
jgi:hypothetical protein